MLKNNTAIYTVYGVSELKWCKKRGYDVSIGDVIEIDISEINRGSRARVTAICDICKKEKVIAYSTYVQSVNNKGFYCCHGCCYQKTKITNIERFGVECTLLNPEVKEKAVNTSMERYGTDIPLRSEKVKEKIRNTCMDKYGVPYPMMLDEIRDKSKDTIRNKYGVDYTFEVDWIVQKAKDTIIKKYGCTNVMYDRTICEKAQNSRMKTVFGSEFTPCSRQQRHIYELYGGELNKNIGGYFVDIFFDNIFFEYDGAGHDLSVKAGWVTQEQYNYSQNRRTEYLKGLGYKEFRIVSLDDVLPSDDKIIKIKELAIQNFDNGYTSFIYNLNTDEIILKK